jgi:type II secretory pathway component PulF
VLVGVRVLAIPLNSPLRRAARWVLAFLPLFGARLRHRALARAAHALEALAESGLTLPEMCRAIAVPALAGPYARSFAKLAGQTEKGQPLSEALPATVLPASFAWFMRAGSMGDFARAMRAAAEYHDARTERLDLLLAMLLPCVVMSSAGLLVASFYLSVLLPIFKMQELVRKH